MKYKLINISRKTAENLPYIVGHNDWLISIYSCDSTPAKITADFGQIFFFQFDDTEEECELSITDNQASRIAQIILEAQKQQIRCLWIHCDAGMCRSGAIVEAAKLLGHLPDDEVSNNRIPNRLVFKKIRISLGFCYSHDCIQEEK